MARQSARFALGIDFGTNSVRSLIVDTADGREIATAVVNYPSGEQGILLDPKDPNIARQRPGDYLASLEKCVRSAVRSAARDRSFKPESIVGIGVDTTGSTPLPVDRQGTPLGMLERWHDDLAAQAWLWKDHTSYAEAAEITELARKRGEPYLAKCGGAYSSEWYWSKILHCRRTSPAVFKAAYGWVECADFISGYLTGRQIPEEMARGICAAGHKAMYSDAWGGLPSAAFLTALEPDLAPLRDRFAAPAQTSDQPAGRLTPEVARRLGLPAGLPVAVGLLDAHSGAVGAGIRPGTLVKIIGTSTCDMLVAPMDRPLPDVPGMSGIVAGSIVPGCYGLEAGQSAVGDIFNWFVGHLAPKTSGRGDVHAQLTESAAQLRPGQSGLLALDWNNGNRCILQDPRVTGLLVGQTLHTTAAEVYRALIEATAFGALTIIRRIEEYDVQVKEVVNCGGIAEKNPLAMQIYADVCNRPMRISRSAQSCALGSAIFGAVVGGAHASTEKAQRAMTGTRAEVYRPNKAAAKVYAELYTLYRQLHDAFGLADHSIALHGVMKTLLAIRDRARA